MKNIIFIAPPAAGKGTQSTFLVKKYGYFHISTGDILRDEIASGSELGLSVKNIIDQGLLVSDDLIISLLKKKLLEVKGKPFILDGFPRTLEQAKILDTMLGENNINNYCVIFLDLSIEEAMKRALGRITCLTCKATYNIFDDSYKPKTDGICDECGNILEKRNDDNEESFKKRFASYKTNTEPIINYYENKKLLININVAREASIVFKDIEAVIND